MLFVNIQIILIEIIYVSITENTMQKKWNN